MSQKISANKIIEGQLVNCNSILSELLNADVIFIRSPITFGLDEHVRAQVESIVNGCNRLVVVLETTGGFVEVTERIVTVFRKHYEIVDFIVPNFAYSAGTILCMSGDNIFMDYFSVLGPIDPQTVGPDGKLVPGTGYLAKYDEFVKKSADKLLTTAELHYFIKRFDQAELYQLEQAREQSKNLLKLWLVNYKFKDWTETENGKKPVTQQMKVARAAAIADTLNDVDRWNSHGRGISMNTLVSEEVKLKIEDFGLDNDLNEAIRIYYDLFVDFCDKMGMGAAIHSRLHTQPVGG